MTNMQLLGLFLEEQVEQPGGSHPGGLPGIAVVHMTEFARWLDSRLTPAAPDPPSAVASADDLGESAGG
jgi:hypothetical protein